MLLFLAQHLSKKQTIFYVPHPKYSKHNGTYKFNSILYVQIGILNLVVLAQTHPTYSGPIQITISTFLLVRRRRCTITILQVCAYVCSQPQ